MILNNTPENSPVLSNVGQIGEFRIRNSAKAFSILSSGLYANKIRAIIRELSCNAVDSHVAAGAADVPFSVHLPNYLEPWFSVRDFGVGLSHDQVINIYTTYFESTKTASNEFIGALGLGSKSPFSYTENFTVTAIQNGRQGIYTAFINEQGVPSIALMTETETTEPNGVEVKFSVNDRSDFEQFRAEAGSVYAWFKLQPTITGATVRLQPMEYERRDLIPGVHQSKNSGYVCPSYAVMGNIAYPIDVPNSQTNLGNLASLLACGLVMEFGIGELDFQASREGLSYIPQTIEAIRQKLASVNDQLYGLLEKEADAISNTWERIYYLRQQHHTRLMKAAAAQYINKHNLSKLFDNHCASLLPQDLQEKYNISLRAFVKSWRGTSKACGPLKDYYTNGPARWTIEISQDKHFVVSDIKQGAMVRAKLFCKQGNNHQQKMFYILEPHDRKQPMDVQGFMAAILNPPDAQVSLASAPPAPERKVREKRDRDVTIMRLERRSDNRRWSAYNEWVWRPVDRPLASFNNDVHFYVPLNGFDMITTNHYADPKSMLDLVHTSGLFGSGEITLHGVRKVDLAQVQQLSNWKNFEEYIVESLTQIKQDAILGIVLTQVPRLNHVISLLRGVNGIDPQSSAVALINKFRRVPYVSFNMNSLLNIVQMYKAEHVTKMFEHECKEAKSVLDRYPLLKSTSGDDGPAVAEYVNLVDRHRETK